jgi:CRP/FNR family cyclic AMP-dependent transcriptional regulator
MTPPETRDMPEPLPTDERRRINVPAFRPDPTHKVWPNETRVRAQALFREIPLFRGVPPHHLRGLARFAHRQVFAAGETIIRMGEVGSTMYAISSGRVEVVLERGAENIVLATLGPGDFFGELSIFDSEQRSATVRAVEETETLTLGRTDILRVLDRSPEMALSLLKSVSARLRAANARVGDTWQPTTSAESH